MPHLKEALSRWDSAAFVTAIVVGVGIFRVPGEVAGFLNSSVIILFAWFLGGMISLAGALSLAELAAMFPESGGNYIYIREIYGKPAAFLFGWSEILAIRPGSIAAVAFVSAEYLSSLLSIEPLFIKPIAISIVIVLSLVNLFGLKLGKKIHNSMTVINISVLIGMVFFGIVLRRGDLSNFEPVVSSINWGVLPLLGLALIPILWTYGGWHESTFVAGETKDAARSIPQALIGGIIVIAALYLAINFLYIYLVPPERLSTFPLIGSEAFRIIFGAYGKKIFETVVVVASIGCINAMIITGSRITYAMAKDNPAFTYLSKVDAHSDAPTRSIIVNGAWASILIALGTFLKLLFFTGILFWFFFAAVAAGVFVLRRRLPTVSRPYKVWGWPVTPAIFVGVSSALFANTVIYNPYPSLAGLCLLASGVPVYYISQLFRRG